MKWLGFFGLLIFVGFGTGCGKASKVDAASEAPTVAVGKVLRRDLANDLVIASEFRPYQEIQVHAKVSGYIQKLYMNWGTHVKQGQLLAVLEIPELQQQLQQDEASVRRSEDELERAREELNRSESAYNVAHLGYTRLAEVQKSQPGLVAQQDIDASQGKDVQAGAGVAGAKDAIGGAEQALLAAKAALEKDKAMYAYSRITAPFDGVVTELHAYTGALLPAGTSSNIGSSALCRLSQNNLLRLVIPVPESAVPEIRLGSPVEVRVPVLNKSFRGTVARFADEVDPSTRTMHTEIDVPNPKLELVPGVYAAASITLSEKQNALAVPIQAVIRMEDRTTVLTVDKDNKIQERTVQLGIETPNQVEIRSGLSEGEVVVVGNRSQLRPGIAVQPKVTSEMPIGGGM